MRERENRANCWRETGIKTERRLTGFDGWLTEEGVRRRETTDEGRGEREREKEVVTGGRKSDASHQTHKVRRREVSRV